MANKTGAVATEQAAQKFTIPQLQKYAFELFGVPTSTFVGATTGLDGEYSVAEVKDIIEKWKNEEAK